MPVDTIAPRYEYEQQTTFIRARVSYNSNLGLGYIHIGTMPKGAFITKVMAYVETAFNAGTTNVLSLGTTFANANELFAAGDVAPATVGFTDGAKGRGTALTQVPSVPEVVAGQSYDTTEGGVGLYAKFTFTGTPPTAGSVIFVVEFINTPDV